MNESNRESPASATNRLAWRVGRRTAPALAIAVMTTALAVADDDPILINAVKNQDKATIAQLFAPRVDVNATMPDGATALHWAVYKDDLQTANLLVTAGAKVDAANDLGITALSLACTNSNAAMIELLLASGADPNIALPSGESPLMTAARTGNIDSVTALLDHGADINAAESLRNQTALMWAISEKHSKLAKLLVARGADIHAKTKGEFSPLLFAVREGDLETVRALLVAGADVNSTAKDGNSALHVATLQGHTETAKLLLAEGANPNADKPGYTPLHWAVGTWETEITGGNGIVTRPDHPWAAMVGVQIGKMDLVKSLIDHGADVNALLKKNPRRYGFTAASTRPKGSTPFSLAALSGNVEIMQLLVDNGADPSIVAKNGVTPLMQAAGTRRILAECRVPPENSVAAVRLILDLGGCDVNAVDYMGDTALHGAGRINSPEIVQLLVDAGADVNVLNKRQQTPLYAAEHYWPTGIARTYRRSAAGDLLRELMIPETVKKSIAEWGMLSPEVRQKVEEILASELDVVADKLELRKQDPVGQLITDVKRISKD